MRKGGREGESERKGGRKGGPGREEGRAGEGEVSEVLRVR